MSKSILIFCNFSFWLIFFPNFIWAKSCCHILKYFTVNYLFIKSNPSHNQIDNFLCLLKILCSISRSLKEVKFSHHLINDPRMFNGAIFDLAEKPYITQKNYLQWVCCKCLAGCNRHIYFWPQRSWRLLEAKNTPRRPKLSWRSWFIEKSI